MNNSPEIEHNIKQLSPLVLAYIGDSVFDVYVRRHLIMSAPEKVNVLHKKATGRVNASAQCESFRKIENMLTADEIAVFKRGRNTKSTPPRNADVNHYRVATGLEALIGYIYLSGNTGRLDEIMRAIL